MPIYEYECAQCGHQLEALQKFSDDPLTICPKCTSSTLNKLISATSFQLKGTGWYVTDIRDKGKAPTVKEAGEVTTDVDATQAEATASDSDFSSTDSSSKTAVSS